MDNAFSAYPFADLLVSGQQVQDSHKGIQDSTDDEYACHIVTHQFHIIKNRSSQIIHKTSYGHTLLNRIVSPVIRPIHLLNPDKLKCPITL